MSTILVLVLNGLAIIAFCVHAGGGMFATPTKISYALIFLSVMAISYLMGLLVAEICRRSGRTWIRNILGRMLLPVLPYIGLLNRADEVGLLTLFLAMIAIVVTSMLFNANVSAFAESTRLNRNLDISLDEAAKSTPQFVVAAILYIGSAAMLFDFISRYAS